MKKVIKEIKYIIKNKGYYIKHECKENGHRFNILNNNDVVSTVEIYISMENIIKVKEVKEEPLQKEVQKKVKEETEEIVFYITWVSTVVKYRGQKLALLLLIYSICYLKTEPKFSNIDYVKLDDTSDRSNILLPNMFNLLGFEFQEDTEISVNNTIISSGPEKQLLLDDEFINRLILLGVTMVKR